jgi:hypothetical protein
VELASEGGVPKPLRITHPVSSRSDLLLLTYDAGYAGTSQIYRIQHGALVDSGRRKVLVDAVMKCKSENGAPRLIQPHWDFQEHSLIITDDEFGREEKITY